MESIKTTHESQPVIEALDNEKVVVAQANGAVTVIYLNSGKKISIELDAEVVQLVLNNTSMYVSTKPFEIPITQDNEESEEVLANNLLASRKTGSRLWKIDISEDLLVISKTFDKAGGFAIDADKIYACNIVSYGFYVLSLDLVHIETIAVRLEPSDRKPWHSNITIIEDTLFLTQEEERIRWFTLGNNIEEKGIIKPEFIHKTSFISVNAAPKKILRVGEHILGVLTSGEPYVIDFVEGNPSVAVDPKTIFTLNYNENSGVLIRVQAATHQYVLAMDRYRIIVSDAHMNTVLHAFCLDEADETLHLTRLVGFEKYAVCFAWTYTKKYPLIVLDLTIPQQPVVIKIIDCGATSGAIKIDLDE